MIRADAARRFGGFVRASIPFDVTFLFILISMLPWHLPFDHAIKPSFLLISIFYWVLHVPFAFPVWLVFLLGLIHDSLGLAPMGSGLLSAIVCFGLGAMLRSYLVYAPIPTILAGFTFVAFISRLVGWMVACYAFGNFLAPQDTIFLFAMDIVLYLPLSYLFAKIQQLAFPSRVN